jgi:hypothetical protein
MRALINTIIAMAATTTTAFAANGGNTDNPGILCWAFFGICALVVACQLIPAALLGIGAAKALVMKPAETKKA